MWAQCPHPTGDGMSGDWDDDYEDEDQGDDYCWRCHGEGSGIVGTDWDNSDPINVDDGTIETCDCCGGTGLADDCSYW